jgi:hypothetical protein
MNNMKQFLVRRAFINALVPSIAILVSFTSIVNEHAFAEETEEKIAEECRKYDEGALTDLTLHKSEQRVLESIVIEMSIYGEQCGFDKSYDYCAKLGVAICKDIVEQRRQQLEEKNLYKKSSCFP